MHIPDSQTCPMAHAGLSPQRHVPSVQVSDSSVHSISSVQTVRNEKFGGYKLTLRN